MSKLKEAAQALITRWDTPLWKDVPATAVFINALRDALAEPEPTGERAELIERLKNVTPHHSWTATSATIKDAADMLEADAKKAEYVPLTDEQIDKCSLDSADDLGADEWEHVFARAIERAVRGAT